MLRILVDREYVADEYFSGRKLHTTPTITRTTTDTDFNRSGQLSPECEILIAQPRVVRCRGEGDGDVDAGQKKKGYNGAQRFDSWSKKARIEGIPKSPNNCWCPDRPLAPPCPPAGKERNWSAFLAELTINTTALRCCAYGSMSFQQGRGSLLTELGVLLAFTTFRGFLDTCIA